MDYSVHNAPIMAFSWAGKTLEGLAKQSFITVTPNSALLAAELDIKNKRALSVLGDTSAQVAINVLYQSPLNAYLMKVAGEYRKGNVVNAPMFVRGDNGNVFHFKMKDCVIMQLPTYDISEDMTGQYLTWTFHCNEMVPIEVDEFNFSVELKASLDGDLQISLDSSLFISI